MDIDKRFCASVDDVMLKILTVNLKLQVKFCHSYFLLQKLFRDCREKKEMKIVKNK